jgi:hypothetical protein
MPAAARNMVRTSLVSRPSGSRRSFRFMVRREVTTGCRQLILRPFRWCGNCPHFDHSCTGGAVVVLIYKRTTTTKHWCETPHLISALRTLDGFIMPSWYGLFDQSCGLQFGEQFVSSAAWNVAFLVGHFHDLGRGHRLVDQFQ